MSDNHQIADLVAKVGQLQQQLEAEQAAHAETTQKLVAATNTITVAGTALSTATEQVEAITGQLAQADMALTAEKEAHAGTIAQLQVVTEQLTNEKDAHAATVAQLAQANQQLTVIGGQLVDSNAATIPLKEQIAAYQAKYEAPPPMGSDIVQVTRWQTSDKQEFPVLVDAQLHAAAVGVMAEAPLTPMQAEALVSKRDNVRKHLAVADSSAAAPATLVP